MKPFDVTPETLQRYLEGKCTEEEVAKVEEWYKTTGGKETDQAAFDQQAHLTGIWMRLREEAQEQVLPVRESRLRPFWLKITGYAAAALLTTALLMWFYQLRGTGRRSLPGADQDAVSVVNDHPQVLKHVLPDGSIAWLSPGAQLDYHPQINRRNQRQVAITGEVFFNVVRDEARPFVVNAELLTVNVLGTSFNVKADPESKKYEVSVVTGKVHVTAGSGAEQPKDVTLTASQKALFNSASGALTSQTVSRTREVVETWQPVSLTFEDATLEEVAKRLENKFALTIKLENPALKNCILRASFENNRLPEILETITQMLGASYELNENTILLKGKGCEVSPAP